MEKKYPDSYEEEMDELTKVPMPSAYAPPEFMGFTHETRQYRGRATAPAREEEDRNE